MRRFKLYHRPNTVDEVIDLISRDNVKTAIVAGGTYINAHIESDVDEVVDLQNLDLSYIHIEGVQVRLGAMLRLQSLVDDTRLPAVVREMAQHEGPNTFRNMGTVGGVVALADSESELLAMMLAHEAEVRIQYHDGIAEVALEEFLSNVSGYLKNGVIIEVGVQLTGVTASARVARTPADKPIVAVVGCKTDIGIMLALCGVADTPVLVVPAELDSLNPPSDFRGSSAYRKQMALTLSTRVMNELA